MQCLRQTLIDGVIETGCLKRHSFRWTEKLFSFATLSMRGQLHCAVRVSSATDAISPRRNCLVLAEREAVRAARSSARGVDEPAWGLLTDDSRAWDRLPHVTVTLRCINRLQGAHTLRFPILSIELEIVICERARTVRSTNRPVSV